MNPLTYFRTRRAMKNRLKLVAKDGARTATPADAPLSCSRATD